MISLHYIYWSLIFLIGIFEILQVPSGIYKAGIPVIGLILFLSQLLKGKLKITAPYFLWVLLFLFVSLCSMVLNQIDVFSLVYFLSYTMLSYFYFLVILNEKSEKKITRVFKFIRILVLIQIPAVLIKFIVLGQGEKGGIGTLSTGAGSLSTVFPLLIIAFLISYYFYTNKKIYLFLIFCYLLFGLIGGKRAIVFYIPLEMILGYLLYLKIEKKKFTPSIIKNFILIPVMAFFAFYFVVKTNPTLNPENSNWGSFDPEFVIDYSMHYNETSNIHQAEVSRQDAFVLYTQYIITSELSNMLLGDGAGKLVESKFKEEKGTMLDQYGVRYGGRMGFIWLILQTGLLGVFFFFGLIYKINTHINTTFKKQTFNKQNPLVLGFFLAGIFMLIDTITYSNSFVRYEVIKGIYFFVAALIIRQQNIVKKQQLSY